MDILELMAELNAHNKTGKEYQIHINSGNLEDDSCKNAGVEVCDLYFSGCRMLRGSKLLCFENSNRKPVSGKEDGVKLYPLESNSSLMIDIGQIESIQNVSNHEDWFEFASEKVVNLYMLPEDGGSGHRNVITIGFMA